MTYLLEQVNYLGNCIISLSNVIYLCKKQNVKFSTDLSKFWTKLPFVDIEKIPFFVKEFENKHVIKSNFFNGINMSKEERLEIITKYIKPYVNINVKELPIKTCVIHVRSGEIFEQGGIHKNYIQPPFAFYKKIIDDFYNIFDEFIVITQKDRRNPVITLLENCSDKIKIQSSSLEYDLSVLLGAQSIISGFGTFIPMILFLSDKIKRIFCLEYCDYFNFFGTVPGVEIIKYDFSKPYVSPGSWCNSEEQIQMMKNFPLENIQKVILGE